MNIAGIEIPQAKIDKLSETKRRILYALYEAHPYGIKTGDLYDAGGSGCQSRKKKLNEDFLSQYGLIIDEAPIKGEASWRYFIKKAGELPFQPVKDSRQDGPEACEVCSDSAVGLKMGNNTL